MPPQTETILSLSKYLILICKKPPIQIASLLVQVQCTPNAKVTKANLHQLDLQILFSPEHPFESLTKHSHLIY